MQKYWDIAASSFVSYGEYLLREISNPAFDNYFYWLLGISLLVWSLEIVRPWRKQQGVFRRDFWLDSFYLLFNFFLFSLIGFNAISNVGVELFSDLLSVFGITNLVALEIGAWPVWTQMLTVFLVADFVQWNVHRLLHRVPWLWQFHKLHHSVKEMGFAAHFRFHWMETIVYKSLQYIPLTMIGIGLESLFVLHVFNIMVGHLNHANLNWNYGPLRYVFNSPRMHIWHHARALPSEHPYGVNYGLTLSIWDYLFGTAYVPQDAPHGGRDIELGFEDDGEYPQTFVRQILYPFRKQA